MGVPARPTTARPYVTASQLKKLIAIAREAGLDVDAGGVEFRPDGTVRLFGARAAAAEPSLFDQWKDKL